MKPRRSPRMRSVGVRAIGAVQAFEIASQAMCPHTRSVYDCVGPAIARGIYLPVAADTAYLKITPCEWVTHLVLWLPGPDVVSQTKRLYPPSC